MAIAIWSLPNQKSFTATKAELKHENSFRQKDAANSFIVMPYGNENGFFSIELENSIVLQESKPWLDLNMSRLKERFVQEDLTDYKANVSLAISELKSSNGLDKVVFSRIKDSGNKGFNTAWLDELRNAYPDAFISFIQDETLGTWITASPELFLLRNKGHLKSFSLAGTKHGKNSELGSKEEKEQRIVTDFIQEAFTSSGLEVDLKSGIEQKAGALTHLLTVVEARATEKDLNLDQLIDSLHPTPAVCGQPKKWAKSFIEFEGYNRQLYTGFLGPYFGHDKFEFYVNLRCAQVFEEGIRFYAGAGITEDSDPEKEYIETEAKMAVLQSVLLK